MDGQALHSRTRGRFRLTDLGRLMAPGGLLAGLALAVLVLSAGAAGGQPGEGSPGANGTDGQPKREYLIKAAIIYNVAKFTRWPAAAFASADAPLRLCVLGADPFGEALATIDGKRVGDRTLRTRLIAGGTQVAGCHVLFVGASEAGRLDAVLAATHGAAILTVADMPDFSRAGGMVALHVVEDRTRFDVNRRAADRAGLELSAKLLRLADRVFQD